MDNRQYYDEFAATYELERHRPYHRMLDELEIELVRRYGEDRDVLEVGCGTGLLLQRIAGFARRAEGVDLSPGMLAHARRRGLSVREASATALPFADETFDVVCSFKVLAHVQDIERAFAECARVTKPGGWVIAELYNRRSLRYWVKRLKPPSAVARDVVDEDVYTRYDGKAQIAGYLPQSLQWRDTRGIRIFTPMASAHEWPVLGRYLGKLERVAADQRWLREFGGFYVICAQKTATSVAR